MWLISVNHARWKHQLNVKTWEILILRFFSTVVKKASDLDVAQSYKISIEMFAPSLQSFVEVGHLATYDDYLSKRLMLKFEENTEKKDKALKSLFVVSGTAINITKVIACIIEQTNGKLMK